MRYMAMLGIPQWGYVEDYGIFYASVGVRTKVKVMDTIFYGHVKLLSFCMPLISMPYPHTTEFGAATFYHSV